MEKSLSYRQKALSGVERIVAGTPSSTISRGLNPCELTRSMKGDAPAVLGGTNGTTPLNDSKNAAGFAARANAVYCIQDLSERRASKTTESPFLRKADEASLSANVASYRIGCSGNLNEKTDT